ncbi:MAG: hypothetical protein J6D15_03240 [Clostridia bacterium]|nr:hypothetical protein [Clostridia bacterium]
MFDFDEYENLDDYTFTYPTLEVLQHTYHKGLKQKDKSLPTCCFQDFIIRHTKFRIQHGYRRYREFEPEWETLYMLISEIKKDYKGKSDTVSLEKAVILFDQALLLFHEGNPLPSYLIT